MSYSNPPSEPVAIVGSSCRFTGGVTSPSKLWDLLKEPTDLSRRVPPGRFNIGGFFHEDGEYHGTTNSPKAYWLGNDHRVFDTSFFNITPKEAEAIDPQQRILLEVVYESLESAGYTLYQYSGQKVAVYAGIMTADYDVLSGRDEITASQYHATGVARSIISNRLSYFYNFHGPSMTIDTACSSSLVALHQAILSLRSGESIMACVTGANLMFTPEQFMVESSLHMLSPTGYCRMWDNNADGYARGEGVAALLIKPLSRALADGDNIQAIIRETGVNSDGRTKGITMPNPEAQAALIRDTYAKSGLDPRKEQDRCQYFEAHGTGTHAGDPREAAAIHEAFFGSSSSSQKEQGDQMVLSRVEDQTKLLVGSVKTVIGHTEGAAGLAGLLKVVQSMRHNTVPPNLHLQNLNPSVRPFYHRLQIPTTVMPWPAPSPGQPLRASVNSFGFGGTNSHAIVERYTPEIHDPVGWHFHQDPDGQRSPVDSAISVSLDNKHAPTVQIPVLLSANSQQSLLATVASYKKYLEDLEPAALNQMLWHLYANRTAFPYRLAVTGNTKEEIVDALDSVLRSASHTPSPEIGIRSVVRTSEPRIIGIFTGQGAQWAGVSKGLLLGCQFYRDSIAKLDDILQSCPHPPEWTLEKEILAPPEASRVNAAAISQPLCTAVQLVLVDILATLGVSFHTVVGHSSGEIAAAYAAGRLSARDAILIAYYRGRFAHLAQGTDSSKGGMVAAGLSKAEAEELCERDAFRGRLCLAASNSPSSVTISGDIDAIHEVQRVLMADGKFARVLMVDTAYHSHHMSAPAENYQTALQDCNITPHSPQIGGTRWVSSVYGDSRAVGAAELASTYWIDNMTKPVLFREAIEQAVREGEQFDAMVEVGPHPQLKGPATQTVKALTAGEKGVWPYSGLLHRKKGCLAALSDFCGFMWTHFGPSAIKLPSPSSPDLLTGMGASAKSSDKDSILELMPRYTWDHSSIHYRESRISHQYHFRTNPPHELLGVRARDDNEFELRWRNILKLESIPWIEHHKFQGQALLPASAYCIMALDAARVLLNGRPASVIELEDIEFISGITIEPGSYGVEVLFTLTVLPPPKEKKRQSTIEAMFTVTSAVTVADGSAPMRKNFHGNLRIVLGEPFAGALPMRPESHSETLPVSSEAFYDMMAGLDLTYTGPFRGIETVERRLDFASTTLLKVHPEDTTSLEVSPAMLDTCFQSCFSAFSAPGDKALWTSFLPRSIFKIRFNLAVCGRLSSQNGERAIVDAYLTDFRPMSREGAATVTGDMCIYNEAGDMEIQVEGMTIGSFAATKPGNDYELYLHTVMQLDPEDEIVGMHSALGYNSKEEEAALRILHESCERVASFYLNRAELAAHPATPVSGTFSTPLSIASATLEQDQQNNRVWSDETKETLNNFIMSSRYFSALDFLSTLGKNLPDMLQPMMPIVAQEAEGLHRFQNHLANIACQIGHRYPRLNVLGVTDPELGLNEHILVGLQSSFTSFTIASPVERNFEQRISLIEHNLRDKVRVEEMDLRSDDADASPTSSQQYDLVFLTTSALEKSTAATLKRIRRLMKPGAFLVLIHISAIPLKDRLRRCAGFGSTSEADTPPTPPDWPDALEESGFVRSVGNADQYYPPGFVVTVRQSESAEKAGLLRPLNALVTTNTQAELRCGLTEEQRDMTEKVLVVGGGNPESIHHTSELALSICTQLGQLCGEISNRKSVEEIAPDELVSCSAVILLSDLDVPTLSTMTEQRLEAFKTLMRPEMVFLWVTYRSRDENAEHAASFGFARTMLAEIPSLRLQMLDFDNTDSVETTSQVISETFVRLSLKAAADRAKDGALLWSHEPEVHIENGRRLVPRVLPYRPAIDRVNASRRIVSSPVNTVERCMEIVPSQSRDGSARYDTKLCDLPPLGIGIEPAASQTTVLVHYSSVDVVNIAWQCSSYICIGRELSENRPVVTLSSSNGSFVRVPTSLVHAIPDAVVDNPAFAGWLMRYLAALSIAEQENNAKHLLFIEPDELLFECMKDLFAQPWPRLTACTTDFALAEKHRDWTFIHPYSAPRTVKAMFSAAGTTIFDFSPEGSELSEMVLDSVSDDSGYHSRFSLLNSGPLVAVEESSGIDALLAHAIRLACAKSVTMPDKSLLLTVPTLLNSGASKQGVTSSSCFQVLDWRAERTVPHLAKHLVETNMLRPYKTYVLIGITRDLGQSLCRLFIQHGARNIVLASRSPTTNPKWRDELVSNSQGLVDIRIEKLDVTDPDDVLAFKERIAANGMPPVAGVVNGAMVLEDRVFAQMSLETLNRVLRPKTVGSKNLDAAFCEPDMEFFIMTSSFAAIGGHAGQSNYAAANMYMNGIAADRRRRGLVGSVLNIGVIYGLGFLHREKDNLYQGLERDGYPPISERDIHHMFLEAIVAGRPIQNQVMDLTTGLSRYRVDDPNPLHWHRDPRFCHFTKNGGEDADGADRAAGQSTRSLRDRIQSTEASGEVVALVLGEMATKLQAMLQLPADSVSGEKSISELGVDSLMAVEIRSWIWKAVGKDVPVMKILGSASISKLCSDIADLVVSDRKAAEEAQQEQPPSVPGESSISEERSTGNAPAVDTGTTSAVRDRAEGAVV